MGLSGVTRPIKTHPELRPTRHRHHPAATFFQPLLDLANSERVSTKGVTKYPLILSIGRRRPTSPTGPTFLASEGIAELTGLLTMRMFTGAITLGGKPIRDDGTTIQGLRQLRDCTWRVLYRVRGGDPNPLWSREIKTIDFIIN